MAGHSSTQPRSWGMVHPVEPSSDLDGHAPCRCRTRPAADPKLTLWTKVEYPWMSLPPPGLPLSGWRDPYIIARPHGLPGATGPGGAPLLRTRSNGRNGHGGNNGYNGKDGPHKRQWSLIIGSGVKDSGGTVLVYTSDNLLDGGWAGFGAARQARGGCAGLAGHVTLRCPCYAPFPSGSVAPRPLLLSAT